MKQDFYNDRDMSMITYTTESGILFSIANKRGSFRHLVQCTKLGVMFDVNNPDMGVKIMKLILGE